MRLALSSAAAPEASLPDLLTAAARRGLAAVELAEGHAHGVTAALSAADAAVVSASAGDAGVEVCGVRRDVLGAESLEEAAALAARVGAPLIVPAEGLAAPLLPAALRAFEAAGATLLLEHSSDPAEVRALRGALAGLPGEGTAALAWAVRPDQDDPTQLAAVLCAAGPLLRYVRLYGGGPEAAQQTGLGVGALMARLALARYGGPVVLTPSTPRFHFAWGAWLGRAGGWGCGSKQSDASLVTLEPTTRSAGERR